MKRLDEIEARTTAATDGPWEVNGPDRPWATISHGSDSILHAYEQHHPYCEGCECGDPRSEVALSDEDAEFITHARQDVPALVAALRAVLELHAPTPSDIYPHDVCHHPHCTDPTDQMEQSPWPCPTVTAIRQHLGEEA